MVRWQKLVLDPAHFVVLKKADQPKRKEEIVEETGLQIERCQKIIQNLKEENLLKQDVDDGVRRFYRANINEKLEELDNSLTSSAIGGTREAIEQGRYSEAKSNLTRDMPVQGETRDMVAQLEVAQKLDSLA